MQERLTFIESLTRLALYAVVTLGGVAGFALTRQGDRLYHSEKLVRDVEGQLRAHEKEVFDRRAWPRLEHVEQAQASQDRALEHISAQLTEVVQEIVPVVKKLAEKDAFITWLLRGAIGLIGLLGFAGVIAIYRGLQMILES